MHEWAHFRAGSRASCAQATNSTSCTAQAGCIWNGSACTMGYCSMGFNPNQLVCDGYPPPVTPPPSLALPTFNGGNPYSPSNPNPAFFTSPANCEFNSLESGGAACVPSMGMPCRLYTTSGTCPNPQCTWNSSKCVPTDEASDVLCSATNQTACQNIGYGFCQWDTCTGYTSSATCQAVYGCAWSGTSCTASLNGGTCRPPLKKMMRANAARMTIVISDEEECYLKDGPPIRSTTVQGLTMATVQEAITRAI